MPLQRRLPKRGFTNVLRKRYSIINIKDLAKFEPDATVDTEGLKEAGLVSKAGDGIKVLGVGEISHPIVIRVHKISKTAREKIEAAGGMVELI